MNDDLLNTHINNIENSNPPVMNVKIRTLDNEFLVNIDSENKVEDLKKQIENISKVPLNRQRLIFRGRLLRDDHSLSSYKICDLDVVHLVAKTGEQLEESGNQEENQMNNDSNIPGRRREGIFSIMNRLIRDTEGTEGNVAGISGTSNRNPMLPAILGRRTRRSSLLRDESLSTNSDFNSIECRETIYQNFAALNNLIDCSNEDIVKQENEVNRNIQNKQNIQINKNSNIIENPIISENDKNNNIDNVNIVLANQQSHTSIMNEILDNSSTINEQTIISKFPLFEFKKTKLIKGQWIDVKDTIDQWLEAQVIDVKDNKVFVHYNGWGTRWDEWIEMDSDRIRPFRFHTRQTNYSHYQCPFPVTKPDANVSLESSLPPQDSFFNMFDEISKNYSYVSKLMEMIKEKRKESSPEAQREVFILSKKLAPLFDKFGRTITDVGGFMNFNMRNNKLEDLDKKLYENSNSNDELKQYTQIEIQQAETEELTRRGRRETGTHVITPVNRLDSSITNQIPLIDSSLYIHNLRLNQTSPQVDIYVHTVITPMNANRNNSGNNSTTTNNNVSDNPFLSFLTNSRHNQHHQNNNQNNNLRQENSSNITLNPTINENNIENGIKREGDELEPQERNLNNSQDLNTNPLDQVPIQHHDETNLNIEDHVNNHRINSDSSFDIIVEEFYENEQDNHYHSESENDQ